MEEQNMELIIRKLKDVAETLCENWAGCDRFSGGHPEISLIQDGTYMERELLLSTKKSWCHIGQG